jgi:flagellar hook-length control protein FliK
MVAQQEVSDRMMSQLAEDAKATSQEQSPLVTPLQTITTKQTTLATEMAQHQAVVNQQHAVVLAQTPVITESTQQNALNQGVAQATVDATLVAQQTVQNASNNVAQNQLIETSPKVAKVQVSIDYANLTGGDIVFSSETTAATPLLVDAQTSDSSLVINDQNAQQTVVDPTLVPDTLVAMQTVTQQVVAQDLPVEQIESDQAFDKGSENSSTNERVTTLTSAKTLLMDAVANRNNSGDAGNGNNSSNTPQNSSLNNDKSLNQSIDNKQNIDAKSFASLLSTEKTDVISVSSADKATPQAVNNVVNKLAQDVKSADVAPLTRPLSHPQWNEDLGERIVWMNSRGISTAEIRMNPEHMGPITVRIDMNQDQATIAFTAQNSVVRDALEASLPKLREMLSAQQVNLADVSVSQQSSSNSDSGRSAFAQAAADMSNGQGNRQNAPEVDAEGNIIASSTTNETVDEFENGQVISTNGTNGLLSIYA